MSKKHTKESILQLLVKLHPTLVFNDCQIQNKYSVIDVTCPVHGKFERRVDLMIHGHKYGCPECECKPSYRPPILSRQEFIDKVKSIYGDKFDLSNVDYTKATDKVTIICPIHGEFSLPATEIANGLRECPICGKEEGLALYKEKKLNEKRLILKKIYGDKYDLTLLTKDYKRQSYSLVCPEHGRFNKSWQGLLTGYGCPVCSHRDRYDKQIRESSLKYEEKARKVHGDKYKYSKTIYTGSLNDVVITCPTHGDFTVRASNHISKINKQGCPYCSKSISCSNDYEQRVYEIHGDKLTLVEPLIDFRNKIRVKCNRCEGIFKIKPNSLIAGHGCRPCNMVGKWTGFDPSKAAYLYLLKLDIPNKESVYKVGITNRHPRKRVAGIGLKRGITYTIEDLVLFSTGLEAMDEEQHLIDKLQNYFYVGVPISKNGHTEMFTIDPRLVLDNCPFKYKQTQ